MELSPALTPETELSTTSPVNIKYYGRGVWDRETGKIFWPEPIETISCAGQIINLPDRDFQKQRRLFYHESAAVIAAMFPGLYKLVKINRNGVKTK